MANGSKSRKAADARPLAEALRDGKWPKARILIKKGDIDPISPQIIF